MTMDNEIKHLPCAAGLSIQRIGTDATGTPVYLSGGRANCAAAMYMGTTLYHVWKNGVHYISDPQGKSLVLNVMFKDVPYLDNKPLPPHTCPRSELDRYANFKNPGAQRKKINLSSVNKPPEPIPEPIVKPAMTSAKSATGVLSGSGTSANTGSGAGAGAGAGTGARTGAGIDMRTAQTDPASGTELTPAAINDGYAQTRVERYLTKLWNSLDGKVVQSMDDLVNAQNVLEGKRSRRPSTKYLQSTIPNYINKATTLTPTIDKTQSRIKKPVSSMIHEPVRMLDRDKTDG